MIIHPFFFGKHGQSDDAGFWTFLRDCSTVYAFVENTEVRGMKEVVKGTKLSTFNFSTLFQLLRNIDIIKMDDDSPLSPIIEN